MDPTGSCQTQISCPGNTLEIQSNSFNYSEDACSVPTGGQIPGESFSGTITSYTNNQLILSQSSPQQSMCVTWIQSGITVTGYLDLFNVNTCPPAESLPNCINGVGGIEVYQLSCTAGCASDSLTIGIWVGIAIVAFCLIIMITIGILVIIKYLKVYRYYTPVK